MEEEFSFHGLLIDLVEGCKIGLFGFGITIAALFINFIPVLGQLLVFLLYSFYSCLMFIDYPSSRRRWTLGKKLLWLRKNPIISFRLGFLPALISLIPILNIFFMALFFPILTVHATLNFSTIEDHK
jgi:CysZ protein